MTPEAGALVVAVAGSVGAFCRKWWNRHEITNHPATWTQVVLTGPILVATGAVPVTTWAGTAVAAGLMGAGVSILGGTLVGQAVHRARHRRTE